MDDVTNRSLKSVAVGIGFLSLVLSSFLLFSPAKEIKRDPDSVDADPVSLDISEYFAGHPKDEKERNAIVSLSSKGAWISRVFDDGQECTSVFFLQDWSGTGNDLHLIDDLYNVLDLNCPDDMTDEEFDALIRLKSKLKYITVIDSGLTQAQRATLMRKYPEADIRVHDQVKPLIDSSKPTEQDG